MKVRCPSATCSDNTWSVEDAACRLLGSIAQFVSFLQLPAAVNEILDLGMVYLHPVQAPPIPHDLPQGLAAQRAALQQLPLCLLQTPFELVARVLRCADVCSMCAGQLSVSMSVLQPVIHPV